MKLDELLPSENKDTVLSFQYGSDKNLDWTSEQQSCSATPLNDIVNSTAITDKLHSRLMDGSDQPSYSSFARFPNTLGTSLWNDTESNPTLMIGTRTSQMQSGFSSIDKARDLLNGGQDGLGTVSTPGNDSGHPGMGRHQPGAMGSVRSGSLGNFDNNISVNKDESRIISDMLSSEFNLWDDSFRLLTIFLGCLENLKIMMSLSPCLLGNLDLVAESPDFRLLDRIAKGTWIHLSETVLVIKISVCYPRFLEEIFTRMVARSNL